MNLQFRPMDRQNALAILSWRYDEPFTLYNAAPEERDSLLPVLLNPLHQYYSVLRDGSELLAFRCYGAEGQVQGGEYAADALDTGGGLRPDLTGRGLGLSLLTAGLAFGRDIYHPAAFRVTVAAFNLRALRVCERAGFSAVQSFQRPSDQLEFIVMLRDEAA